MGLGDVYQDWRGVILGWATTNTHLQKPNGAPLDLAIGTEDVIHNGAEQPPRICWLLPDVGAEDVSKQEVYPGDGEAFADADATPIGRQIATRRAAVAIHIWMATIDDGPDGIINLVYSAIQEIVAGDWTPGRAGWVRSSEGFNQGYAYVLEVTFKFPVVAPPLQTVVVTGLSLEGEIEEPQP